MAKKSKETREERIGNTVERFDAGVQRHFRSTDLLRSVDRAVPKGSGGFRRQLRCKPLKEITLPAGLRLVSGEILSDQSRTINGS
jgi:hypothetical protein